MTVDILFSGSRGNCTLIRSGEAEILIDCGKSARAVTNALRALGTDIGNISAIFITHEHSDHTSALESVCQRHAIPVHVTIPSSEKLLKLQSVARCTITHPVEYTAEAGDLKIKSFPLPHDSAAHVGYVVEDEAGDRLGIATDMGHITEAALQNLSHCRRVIIEANHDLEMLKEGSYPSFLKKRILSSRGHLSNADCADLICSLADSGVECFALAHLSPENNLPSLAYSEVRCALDSSGFSDRELVVCDREFTVHLPDGSLLSRKKDVIYAEN